jgi:hypothetical protein
MRRILRKYGEVRVRMAPEMQRALRAAAVCAIACAMLCTARVACAQETSTAGRWQLPPDAVQALQQLYSGDSDAAMKSARQIEAAEPQNPLGYLLEAEIDWWSIFCANLEWKWNFLDVWHHPAEDALQQSYMQLAGNSISLAETQIARQDTAEMELYDGMGYIMRGRLLGLREDRRGAAHAGVSARQHLMRASELDPEMADADTGLGLYNYYVDTLSGIAKVLRFFMGIPGGSKKDGIQQLENAMEHGRLTAVEARFYLAKNLRTYDRDYARAADLLEPLAQQYPQNPVFALMLGNMNSLLNRKEKAAAEFQAAKDAQVSDSNCATKIAALAEQGLAALQKQ